MASQKNFSIKNGLTVAGTERISSSGDITGSHFGSFSGTSTTRSAGTNNTQLATTAFVTGAISDLVDSSPGALNTLNELAAALGDDANFSTTVTNSIATKLPLAGGTLTGNLIGTSATFTDDVAINNGSPELYFGTTGNHYNWRIAAQENVDAAFEISVGSQDTNYANDTYNTLLTVKNDGKVGIGTTNPLGNFVLSSSGAEGIEFFPRASSGVNTTQHYNRSGSAYVKNRTIALNHEWTNSATDPAMNLIPDGNSTFLVIKAKAGTYLSTANLSLYGTNPNANGGSLVSRATIQAVSDGTAFGTKMHLLTNNTSNVETKGITIDAAQNVGIGRTDPTQLLEVHKNTGGDQTVAKFSAHNYGDTGKTFIEIGTEYGDGSSRIGSFNDTGNSSVLVFDTHSATTGQFTERMRIKSDGAVTINSPGAAGHSFEVQDKSDGYSTFWTGRSSSGEGRGITTSYGLMGVNSTQYDGDGAYYPAAGFAAAADNNAAESVDFWFGSTQSEWQPMVIYAVGASTQTVLTGQTAGWACIRCTHFNNGISSAIVDSGGGGTFSVSVIGSFGADRAGTSRVRVTYTASSNNRTVMSAWATNYSLLYGATR